MSASTRSSPSFTDKYFSRQEVTNSLHIEIFLFFTKAWNFFGLNTSSSSVSYLGHFMSSIHTMEEYVTCFILEQCLHKPMKWHKYLLHSWPAEEWACYKLWMHLATWISVNTKSWRVPNELYKNKTWGDMLTNTTSAMTLQSGLTESSLRLVTCWLLPCWLLQACLHSCFWARGLQVRKPTESASLPQLTQHHSLPFLCTGKVSIPCSSRAF